jgi:hypothetical protein
MDDANMSREEYRELNERLLEGMRKQLSGQRRYTVGTEGENLSVSDDTDESPTNTEEGNP